MREEEPRDLAPVLVLTSYVRIISYVTLVSCNRQKTKEAQ